MYARPQANVETIQYKLLFAPLRVRQAEPARIYTPRVSLLYLLFGCLIKNNDIWPNHQGFISGTVDYPIPYLSEDLYMFSWLMEDSSISRIIFAV